MEEKHLISVERVTLALSAVAIVVAIVAFGHQRAFGVALGAGLMSLNALVLRRLGARIFKTWKRPGVAVLLLNVKMGILVAIVWAIVRFAHVDPLSFIVGISVFPLAIFVVAVKHALRHEETPANG